MNLPHFASWDFWDWFWFLWTLSGAGVEGAALAINYKGTYSEKVWAIEGPAGSAAQWFVGAFTLWLFLHLTFHIFR